MSLALLATDSEKKKSTQVGANTDLWNQCQAVWNTANFLWGTGTVNVFDPSQNSGLLIWTEADGVKWQNSTLTTPAVATGDPIGALIPKGGAQGNWLQATAGVRMKLQNNAWNGLPSIRGGAENGFLTLASSLTGIGDFSLFIVAKCTVPAGVNYCSLLGDKAGTNWAFTFDYVGATQPPGSLSFLQGGTACYGLSKSWDTNYPSLYEVHRTGTAVTFVRDGIDVTQAGNSNNQTISIGELSGRNGGVKPLIGDFFAAVMCAYTPPGNNPTDLRYENRQFLRNKYATL
jgi:hypothetical protein